jgi:hypothetical protein
MKEITNSYGHKKILNKLRKVSIFDDCPESLKMSDLERRRSQIPPHIQGSHRVAPEKTEPHRPGLPLFLRAIGGNGDGEKISVY